MLYMRFVKEADVLPTYVGLNPKRSRRWALGSSVLPTYVGLNLMAEEAGFEETD